MDRLHWFKIQIIYSLTSGIEEEEMSEIEIIRLRNEGLEDGYEVLDGYFNLLGDPISYLTPHSFIPKDKVNKKHYTTITFQSGNIVNAVGKPSDVYDRLNEYLDGLPNDVLNVVT